MVILGGLEVVAAGWLINEFNKDKIEARERRKRRDDDNDDDRPHSRPPRPDSQRPSRPSQSLAPPSNHQRPSSAPPTEPRPGGWQPQQQQYLQPPPPYQQRPDQRPPQPAPNPYQQAIQNDQRYGQHPAPWQGPPQPGPGHLQRPNTFQPGQQGPQPQQFPQQAYTFPIQQHPSQPAKPAMHTYIDTKTGKISHNLYPPDHPMARGYAHDDLDMPNETGGGNRYQRSVDDDDLAYGKSYTDSRRQPQRSNGSYERARPRARSNVQEY